MAWAWIPLTLWAALAQTARNAAQRSVTAELGTLAATLVRFLYGLPLASAWVAGLTLVGAGYAVPHFTLPYAAWLAMGALTQVGATAFLLLAMKERNFVLAVAYSKTEVLQVALFSAVLLQELPGPLALGAMAVATLGVVLLSLPAGGWRALRAGGGGSSRHDGTPVGKGIPRASGRPDNGAHSSAEVKVKRGCGSGARSPNSFACSQRTPRRPGPLVCEGSALAVSPAAHGLVFTRGTPPRTEGCRTAGRGLMAVTHDLRRNVREVAAVPQPVSGWRDGRTGPTRW